MTTGVPNNAQQMQVGLDKTCRARLVVEGEPPLHGYERVFFLDDTPILLLVDELGVLLVEEDDAVERQPAVDQVDRHVAVRHASDQRARVDECVHRLLQRIVRLGDHVQEALGRPVLGLDQDEAHDARAGERVYDLALRPLGKSAFAHACREQIGRGSSEAEAARKDKIASKIDS
eukprot:2719577-Pleurochrysis_carterae.AAC.2